MNPTNTLYDVKRIIGRGMDDEVVVKEAKNFPFKVLDGGQQRPVIEVEWRGSTRRLTPEEVNKNIVLLCEKTTSRQLLALCPPQT